LRCYATSRKVAGSSPDEIIEFVAIYLILPAAPWPWGLLLQYQKIFLGVKHGRRVRLTT
jgi:hypothetical protein